MKVVFLPMLFKSDILAIFIGLFLSPYLGYGQLEGSRTLELKDNLAEGKVFTTGYSSDFIYSPDSLQLINQLIEKSNSDTKDSIFFNLGKVYRERGNYNASTFYFYQGLELAEQSKSMKLQAKYLTNIGTNHKRSGSFDKSIEFYRQALAIYLDLKDSLRISYLYNNISLWHFEEQMYDSALVYYQAAIKLKKQLGKTGLALQPNNPGQFHHKLKQYDKAIYYHQLSLNLLAQKKERDYPSEAFAHSLLADVYSDMKKNDKALEHYHVSLSLSQQSGAKETTEKALGGIANVYANMKDYQQAYYYGKLQKSYVDTLARNSNQIAELEAKYQLRIQDHQFQLSKAKDKAKLSRKNVIIIIISGCIILLVAIIYTYKRNLQSERILNKKNELLSEQKINKAMKEKELKSLKAFVDGQEKERLRVARDLHDGLGGTLAGLKLNFERSLENSNTPNIQHVLSGLDMVYKEVKSVASNLAPPKFQSTYFIDILHSYITNVSETNKIQINAEFQPESALNLVPEKIKIEIYRIIQELITNIIKHAQATEVEIQLLKHPNFVNLIIEDNGKGFNSKKKHKGMGISNVMSRVEILKGKVDIDSGMNRGTLFNIDIPI